MKKITMLPVLLLFVFMGCFSQETGNDSRFFVQIEDTRFYPRYSHKNDVEAFLGPPSSTEFFEQGGEGFYWGNFYIWDYEEEMLSFHFSREGYIIRITVNSSYSGEVFILDRSFNELNHATVTGLLGQTGIEIFYTTERFIGSFAPDSTGSEINVFFWFDDESNITWLSFGYDRPW